MSAKKEHYIMASGNKHRSKGDHKHADVSLPSLNPEIELKKHNTSVYNKLIQLNQGYLEEKVKIKDIPTPSKYSHKFPSKTGTSEYNTNYKSLIKGLNLKDSTIDRYLKESPPKSRKQPFNNYHSVYNADYNEHQNKSHEVENKRNVKVYQRVQIPMFNNQSSYNRDYAEQKISANLESGKRQGTFFLGNGIFTGDSTYKHDFKQKSQSFVRKPIIKQDHTFFTKIINPVKSSYRSQFLDLYENRVVQESFKPKTKVHPMIKRSNFKTEYSDVYINKPIVEMKETLCLSKDELKKYVFEVLDKK